MRKDINERILIYKMNDIKPNFAELARTYECDYRTVKKYYEGTNKKQTKPFNKRPSKLDQYESLIDQKLDLGCSYMSIYHFIKDKGYQGKYYILRKYCNEKKEYKTQKATIRIETSPGLSGQVDWKESMTLYNRKGEPITFNLFLFVLGYSRLKYVKLTTDRKQDTLFYCLVEVFENIEGVPKEIWFDNMKTVVDQAKTQFHKTVFNQQFYQFSKDMGFCPIACRPYRPQTKGKVESLAKLVERLRVYNYEFDDIADLNVIVQGFVISINCEESQATNYKPNELWLYEKEHLSPLADINLLESYRFNSFWRKVTKESMVTYLGNKYSVSPRYIHKEVEIKIHQEYIYIYYNEVFIQKHLIGNKMFNYTKENAFEILRSDVMRDRSDEDIENFIDENMNLYDQID